MSITEILLILIIAVLVLKPEDIPSIFKNIRAARKYLQGLYKDIMHHLEEPKNSPENVNEMNKYLGKIIELEGKYDGKYEIDDIKAYYHKLLKTQVIKRSE
ncbi:MAG: DUF2672 domain-containing protein [Pseudomonadota bacterium]